jgi:D-lactate dehydrogenase
VFVFRRSSDAPGADRTNRARTLAGGTIKLPPSIEEEVDRCVGCGYCEPVCPSRDLTLSPRQRIVLRREIRNAERAGDAATVGRLEDAYSCQGVHTCAVEGLCGKARRC